MSHDLKKIETENGTVYCMAYLESDPPPWHAAQTFPATFPANATALEVMNAANLASRVAVYPNHRAPIDGVPGEAIPDSYYIADAEPPHRIHGRFIAGHWTPVQVHSTLDSEHNGIPVLDWVDMSQDARDSVTHKPHYGLFDLAELIHKRHGFKYSTAGALFGGERVFVQLEAPESFTLPGNDEHKSRLLCSVSHIGAESNKFVATDVRVVCSNTDMLARMDAGERGTLEHDHRAPFDVEIIETAVGLNRQSFEEHRKLLTAMTQRTVPDAEVVAYFRAVLGGKETADKDTGLVIQSQAVRKAQAYYQGREFVALGQKDSADAARIVSEKMDDMERGARNVELPDDVATAPAESINPGREMTSAMGTLYGLLNTVTWLADHRPNKDRGVDYNLAGNLGIKNTRGTAIKAKAMAEATKMLQPAA